MQHGALDVSSVLDGARLVVFGGTGFLGKIFWSMLLHRYPNVGRVYLVVRPKDGGSPEQRFWSDVAPTESVAPLRSVHGDRFDAFLRDKVVPIDGDMGRALCGVDAEIVRELRGTIDAVVNVAGVVDFNPPLDDALHANAFGAQNLVALASALGAAPIMHTSTCYVAGTRSGLIREDHPCVVPFPRAAVLGSELWDPDREIAECLDLIAQATHRCDDAFRQSDFAERARKNLLSRGEPTHGDAYDRELALVKRKFISDRLVEAGLDRATHWGWPNIYTYTKAIGEQVIARSGLPFSICRPACCESTVAYPAPAYNEGMSTSALHAYLIMKGEPHILGKHVPLDFIPADYVVAGMILTLAELLEGTARPVYQFGAADVNPCTVQRFGELMGLYKRRHYRQKSSGNVLWNALQARYEPVFVDRARFDALGPPAIARATREFASIVRRVAPGFETAAKALDRAASREGKIAEIQDVFAPFTTTRLGPFDCTNTRAAYARLSEEDKRKLPWAPESIDWADWMMNIHMPAMEKRIIPEMDRRLKKPPRALAAHRTLVSLLDEMAERHDLALALQEMTDDGLTRTTFRDLKVRAWSTAARLAAFGVGKGDRVALAARNQPSWAIAYFGILRAGATAVPIDPALDAAGWGNVLAESGARVLIWDDQVKAREHVAASHPGLVRLDLHTATEADASLVAPEVDIGPGDVASLIYTSGTTGRPKGVMLTHANFASLVAALAPIFPLSDGDAVLSVVPLHHTFELTCGLLLPLSRGARVVYVGELTGDRIARGLRASRARAMVGVPALWQLLERRVLMQVDARGPLARTAFDVAAEANRWVATHVGTDMGRLLFGSVHAQMGGRMKWLISGGAALPRETHEFFLSLGLRLTQGYGLTEAAPVLTVTRPHKRLQTGVGEPVPGVEVKISNPDDRGVGEVIARGPNVMIGYTDEQATDSAIDAEGWLHTGDLGRIDRRGQLEIVGRIKDVVISPTGENVYPEDVEQRLGSVPHVVELAVVGVEIQGTERLACLAVPAEDQGESARAALQQAIGALPLAQRPAIVHLYDTPLPRTATRKIKRDGVRTILERIIVTSVHPDAKTVDSSSVRRAISAVRGIPMEQVSTYATLHGELGFDSLLLTELLELLEARFGQVDPQRLQSCITVGDVEALVEESPRVDHRPHPVEAAISQSRIVLPQPVQEMGRAFIGKLQDVFYGDVLKPRVVGRAHIPHNRNVIVVSNHASHLDMGFVRYALGKYGEDIVSFAAQDYFFDGTIKRAFFENLTNLKAIDRKTSLREAMHQASEVLERGRTVLIFPEGTRSESGELREFKPLVGHLALVHGVDVLPLFLAGTHAAMPKGARVPMRRDIVARIGPPLCVADLRRLTDGMSSGDAAREVARMARSAVVALSERKVLDLRSVERNDELAAVDEHPLVKLFGELEAKFRAGEVIQPVSYYVSLGNDQLAKWTVRVDAMACDVRPGKPQGGQADCVLKTSPEIFAKIVRESYVPSPADFLSGAIRSNDVALLMT
ncbi:MAG: AMP-binding protein, partial [Myxococcota bacterium]|nr:AMP-binding protein [Myxococcota bacterium]